MLDWSIQPVLPWSLWGLLAAVTLAALFTSLGRGVSGSRKPWRGLAMTAPAPLLALVLLLNPGPGQQSDVPAEALLPAPDDARPRICLLLDTSASMSVRDESGRRSRYQAALADARKLFDELVHQARLEIQGFDQRLAPMPITALPEHARGPTTHLQSALMQILFQDADQRPQALVLLSDGIDQQTLDPRAPGLIFLGQAAGRLGLPIHTRTYGRGGLFQDVSLELVQEQTLALRNGATRWRLRVHQQGLAGKTIRVHYLGSGRGAASGSLLLDQRPTQELVFDIVHTQSGVYLEDWQVESLEEEATAENNRATGFVRVLEEPLRVLVLETRPSLEHRQLLRELENDVRLRVQAFLELGPGRWLHRSWGGLPPPEATSAERPGVQQWEILDQQAFEQTWRQAIQDPWEVLLLGSPPPILRDDAVCQRIVAQVAQAGRAIVFPRGLSRTEPISWPEQWFSLEAHPDPSAIGPESPGLRRRTFGLGQVAIGTLEADAHASPGFWLNLVHSLALSSKARGADQVRLQARQLVHEPHTPILLDLAWSPDRNLEVPSRVLVQSLDPAGPPRQEFSVRVQSPAGGWSQVHLDPLPPGRYRAWLEGDETSSMLLEVRDRGRERLDLQPRHDLMAQLAELSGGTVLTESLADQIASHWQQSLLSRQAAPLSDPGLTPGWKRPWVLATLLGLACLAWWGRPRENPA